MNEWFKQAEGEWRLDNLINENTLTAGFSRLLETAQWLMPQLPW